MAGRLTDKQALFVQEYLVDLNATQAAIRAGYSEKMAGRIGHQLLEKTRVQEAIQNAQKAREKRTQITQDYVLNNLLEIVERTMQRAPVVNMKGEQVVDEDGNSLWEFDAKNAISALEKIGKHLGMFKEKVETEISGGLSLKWDE